MKKTVGVLPNTQKKIFLNFHNNLHNMMMPYKSEAILCILHAPCSCRNKHFLSDSFYCYLLIM